MSFTSLGTVKPGDVITADYINGIAAEVNALGGLPVEIGSIGARVSALEASVSDILSRLAALEAMLSPPASPPDKTSKEGKETKDGKEKEKEKDTKDVKDKEEGKDLKDGSKDIKELSKDAKDEKERIKEKDKEKEKDTKENVKERIKEGKEAVIDKADQIEKLRDFGPGPHPLVQEATVTPVAASEPVAHFIPAALRPDLSLSPLSREGDLAGVDGTGPAARPGG